MKILHIIDSLGLGGAQTVVRGIFEYQKANKDIFLYALRNREVTTQIDHPHVTIYPSNSKYSLLPLLKLRRIIIDEQINILHCHLFRSQVFGWILKTLFFPKITLLFHEHGQIVGSDKNNKTEDILFRFFISHTQGSVKKYIAVSKYIKEELEQKGSVDESKITVLYNFVDLNKFSKDNITWNIADERIKIGLNKESFVVGFAGRLVERKGWKDFLDAAKLLQNEDNSVQFLIAGDGPDREALLQYIKFLKLENNVVYLGYYKDMLRFYSLIDCFVIPSHWEGLPMTQLEVLSVGTPLISSNGPGLNEVAEDGESCLYFPIHNAGQIVSKLMYVKSDREISRLLISKGHETARLYSIHDYILKLSRNIYFQTQNV